MTGFLPKRLSCTSLASAQALLNFLSCILFSQGLQGRGRGVGLQGVAGMSQVSFQSVLQFSLLMAHAVRMMCC